MGAMRQKPPLTARARCRMWLVLPVVLWLWPPSGPARAAAPAGGDKAPAVREMPCPDAPARFDFTAIRRELKEPRYGSDKPLYRFLALGPEGKTIVAMVADESRGEGDGVDTLYVDLNANGDITEPAEKFAVPNPRPPSKPPNPSEPGLVKLDLGKWGDRVLPETRLPVPDPALEYRLSADCSIVKVITSTPDGFWRTTRRIMDNTLWSTSRKDAPVFRVGGSEFLFGNENFVEVNKGRGPVFENGVGRTLRPGAKLSVDGTVPYFTGASPSAQVGWIYVEGGHRNLRAWIESVEDPSQPVTAEIILRGY